MNIRKQQKAALRLEIKALRTAVLPEQKKRWDAKIFRRLRRELSLLAPTALLLYYPLPGEPDILPLFEEARHRGIPCAFPRCGETPGEMEFYRVDDLNTLLPGKFGVREPSPEAPLITAPSNALILVPGLAFDTAGHRLGYGGGYYDRYLTRHSLTAAGVVYHRFLCASLPHEENDIPVTLVVTDQMAT